MNQARAAAGSFMSRDKSSLFAFGGSHDSVERLSLTQNGTWQMLKVEFPTGIAFKGGLTMLPMWHYCQQLENIAEEKVLIFGGGLKEVYSYDFHSNVVSEVHEAEEGSSRPASPDSPTGGESSKTLTLSRDDWFIAQPVLQGKNLVLMGLNHIYFMDLGKSKTQIRKHKGRNYI